MSKILRRVQSVLLAAVLVSVLTTVIFPPALLGGVKAAQSVEVPLAERREFVQHDVIKSSKKVVIKDKKIEGNLILVASYAEIRNVSVSGDIILAASTAKLSDVQVGGNVFLSGNLLTLKNVSAADIIGFGNTLRLKAAKSHVNLLLAGNVVEVLDAKLDNAYIAGNTVTFSGVANRLHLGGNYIDASGIVKQTAYVGVSKTGVVNTEHLKATTLTIKETDIARHSLGSGQKESKSIKERLKDWAVLSLAMGLGAVLILGFTRRKVLAVVVGYESKFLSDSAWGLLGVLTIFAVPFILGLISWYLHINLYILAVGLLLLGVVGLLLLPYIVPIYLGYWALGSLKKFSLKFSKEKLQRKFVVYMATFLAPFALNLLFFVPIVGPLVYAGIYLRILGRSFNAFVTRILRA